MHTTRLARLGFETKNGDINGYYTYSNNDMKVEIIPQTETVYILSGDDDYKIVDNILYMKQNDGFTEIELEDLDAKDYESKQLYAALKVTKQKKFIEELEDRNEL